MNCTHVPYVYELIDPRDKAVFYVGKGRRNRAWEHVRQAKNGRFQNKNKNERILQILSDNLEVIVNIIGYYETDIIAGEAEKIRIKEIGLQNLTNIKSGGCADITGFDRTNWPRILVECYDCLMRLKHEHIVSSKNIYNIVKNGYIELYQKAYNKLGSEKAEWLLLNYQI